MRALRLIAPRFFAAALLLHGCATAFAATYYVRTDGNNNSCNGTADASSASAPDCAFLTIQKGVDIAQAGDTVTVAAGSGYAGFSSARSGVAGSPITITRRGADTVTLSSAYPTGQVRIEHNYITVNGLTFTLSDSYEGGASLRVGYSGQRNHITITNCRFSANGANTFIATLYADDVLFDSNDVAGPKFFIGLVQSGQRHTVSNSKFHDVTDVERVFNVAASNSSYIGNEIYGCTWTGNASVHPDIWQTIQDGSSAANVVIENNYIHDFNGCQAGNMENTGSNVNNWTFRNNVFANTGTMYIHTANFKFHNNTYYRASTSGQATVLMYDDGWGSADGAEFRNNIYILDGNQSAYGVSGGTVTYSANYNFAAVTGTWAAKSGFSEPNGTNGGNPQFVAAFANCMSNVCDFHVGATSAAVGKGTTLSGFTTDKDGAARSVPWDAGAYEYQSGGGLLPGPTNLWWRAR